jgi:YD repeat-containing protein
MRITYDPEVDALYIRFHEATVTTKHLADGLAVDYDADGRLAGIEILDALKQLGGKKVFKQITIEDVALRSYQ